MKAKTKPQAKPERAPVVPPPGAEILLKVEDVRAALRIGQRKMAEMLAMGEFPKADIKLGILNRWRVSTLNAWIQARYDAGRPQ